MLENSFSSGYELFYIEARIIIQMNIEQRLSNIFPQSFQVNRIVKEIEQLKQAKSKMGLQLRFINRNQVQFVIIVEIIKGRLKQIKKLAFLDHIQIKIVLHPSYPTQPPSLYILNQNAFQLGINPFYNYLKDVCVDWAPKISILQIVKLVPIFMIHAIEKTKQIVGQAMREYFQVQRLFSFQRCQIFPVKLIRKNIPVDGILGIINNEQIILLQSSHFANIYQSCNLIKLSEIASLQKHKSNYLRVLLEIKRNNQKYAIEFMSDEFQTIANIIIEKIKTIALQKVEQDSSQSEDEIKMPIKQKENEDFHINDQNIKDAESQIMILQSLIDNRPDSKNVKEIVELLKKAVEYYSIKGDQRCQAHLKSLQSIMNNQFLQILLLSEDQRIQAKNNKSHYQSITDYI